MSPCEFCGGTGYEWRDYWSQDAEPCRRNCPVPEAPEAARLRAHAERLANDPDIAATLTEIDRRLEAGEPLDDLLGPGITADEFRSRYLHPEAPEGGSDA